MSVVVSVIVSIVFITGGCGVSGDVSGGVNVSGSGTVSGGVNDSDSGAVTCQLSASVVPSVAAWVVMLSCRSGAGVIQKTRQRV